MAPGQSPLSLAWLLAGSVCDDSATAAANAAIVAQYK